MQMTWEFSGKPASLEDMQNCVGKGWHALIKRLVDDITKMGWNGVVAQVKEKFGTLRFYIGGATTQVHDRISQAEAESAKTCEWCGKPGKIDEKHMAWWLTLCPECVELRAKQRAEAAAKYKRREELQKQNKPILYSFVSQHGDFPSFDSARFEFPHEDNDTMRIMIYLKYDAPNVYPETFEGFKVERYVLHMTRYRMTHTGLE